ncbi:hypothetical protein [Algoriphagus sp. NG3]|uniref:hypothetical protein n=1 Tax=Algoriphagus sp. NG3 TaxID=3097546 RepID=UPI002A7EDF99|nr:hypothetical protein [Algoriphagus sp. NG3]WPR77481.1 hypothetical protein SLW71_08985 [Algoriphagus sp. NG3]
MNLSHRDNWSVETGAGLVRSVPSERLVKVVLQQVSKMKDCKGIHSFDTKLMDGIVTFTLNLPYFLLGARKIHLFHQNPKM